MDLAGRMVHELVEFPSARYYRNSLQSPARRNMQAEPEKLDVDLGSNWPKRKTNELKRNENCRKPATLKVTGGTPEEAQPLKKRVE